MEIRPEKKSPGDIVLFSRVPNRPLLDLEKTEVLVGYLGRGDSCEPENVCVKF